MGAGAGVGRSPRITPSVKRSSLLHRAVLDHRDGCIPVRHAAGALLLREEAHAEKK